MKRAGVIVVIAILAIVGVGFAYVWRDAQHGHDAYPVLKLYGNVEIRDADLAFFGEAHIADVLVEEGDQVKRGQPLAHLKTDRLESEIARAQAEIDAQAAVLLQLELGTREQEIDQARAEVVAADARVSNAKRMLDRLQDTARSGASSAQDLDDARSRLEVEEAARDVKRAALALALEGPRKQTIAQARAQLEALRAELSLLNNRLDDATLVAPEDGIVQTRILEPGEYATPARPVLTLALTDPKWVRAYVPQPDLGKIKEGMQASVHSDTFPDQPFDGWIGFISPMAEFTPKTVQTTDLRTRLVYEVRVYVKDPKNQLRLGQPVTIEVDLDADVREDTRATTPSNTTDNAASNGSVDAGSDESVNEDAGK